MRKSKIITADKNCGKTTYIKGLINSDCNAVGFFTEKDSASYSLVNIREGSRDILLSLYPISQDRFRKWYVNENAFIDAFSYIQHCKLDNSVLYLDEIGMLECEKRGFSPILTYADKVDASIVVTIRISNLSDVLSSYPFLKEAEIVQVPFLH